MSINTVKRPLLSLRAKVTKLFGAKHFKILALLSLGVVLGLGIGRSLWADNQPISKLSENSQTKKREAGFVISKNYVSRDLNSKKINQEQSDKINKKLDEIRIELEKINTDSREGREQLRDKKEEWKKWFKDNNLSTKYIVAIR